MKATDTVKVALPTAQGVRDPEQEGSGYCPNGIFVTLTSEAIRQFNGKNWVITQDSYRKRKAARQAPRREDLTTAIMARSLSQRAWKAGAR